MFSNHIKIAWRNIVTHKKHSFINIAGLSVGLACSLLIFLWVKYERSVDAFHANNERLYKLYEREYYKDHTDGNYDMPGLLAKELKKQIPDIEDAIMMQDENQAAVLQSGEKIIKVDGTAAGAGLFTMFSYPLLQGNAATALNAPVNISLSRNTAEALFGKSQNAIGKTIRFNDREEFTVTAVFENLPLNVSRHFDYVINWDAWLQHNDWAKDWGNSGPVAFVLLRENADAALVDKKLTHFLNAYNKRQSDAYRVELGLQKFSEIYLQNHFTAGKIDGGRIEYVRLFTLIAVFILLIACINFMNLATARSVKRAKEVGVRKAIGALRSSLIKQFCSEALVVSFLAVVIALVLTMLVLPVFNQVTGRQLRIPYVEANFWLYIGAITLVTGLVSGSYPALYLSSFNPVKVLKGTTRLSRGAVNFRKGLVVLQFVVSLVLIVGTIVVSRQVHFIQNRNIGYDKENLVYIPLTGTLRSKLTTFSHEIAQIPGVQSTSAISDNPSHLNQQTNGVDWEGRNPNILFSVEHPTISYDFVRTMKLTLLAGRDFSKDFSAAENGFLLNETAVKKIGYTDAIGKSITVNGRKAKITGIVKDFHFRSIHEPIQPMIMELNGNDVNYVILRIEAGKTKTALAGIEKLSKRLNPAFPFVYSFSSEEYLQMYQNEQMIGKLSNAFAGLAIFISCLGLLGLIMFTAEQRNKEIGIRKVLGASVQTIFRLLSADLLLLVLLSIVVATPLAWWMMQIWLSNYAYKIDISWWMFAAAAAAVIFIALFTISVHVIKSATANPVKSLKTE